MAKEAELVGRQYAQYLKVDSLSGVKTIEDAIDETLTRLDEYSSLIDMVRAESSVEKCNNLLASRGELELLFEKIRKLEFVVAKVKEDVEKVEILVEKAETDHGVSTEGRLRHLLRPFFKRATVLPVQGRAQARFLPPELFTTKSFFKEL